MDVLILSRFQFALNICFHYLFPPISIGLGLMLVIMEGLYLKTKNLKYKEMIQPRYVRRDLIRYELHRVWVVEATVKPDKRHTIARRAFYLDEDTWLFVAADGYDTRGDLWRVSEHLPQLRIGDVTFDAHRTSSGDAPAVSDAETEFLESNDL